jgi:prepilin-type N-terminal cleavage/methylation domain-containing protein
MNRLSSKSGWSLIEIVLVVALVSMLAMAVFAYFYDIMESAELKNETYIIGSVQEGVNIDHAQELVGE